MASSISICERVKNDIAGDYIKDKAEMLELPSATVMFKKLAHAPPIFVRVWIVARYLTRLAVRQHLAHAWEGHARATVAEIDVVGAGWDFASRFPLPFRIQVLQFALLLGWATNLHLLAFLGIDTSLVLDIRLDDYRGIASSLLPTSNAIQSGTSSAGAAAAAAAGVAGATTRSQAPFVHPSRLYPPLYILAGLGFLWTTVSWAVFMRLTGGDAVEMVKWRGVPAFSAFAVGTVALMPMNILFKKERMMFIRSMKRIVLGSIYSPVPFSDIILADILTSSAKVLGDVWSSGCMLFSATTKFGLDGLNEIDDACGRVKMVPIMTSLPYLFRFRQCLAEVFTGSTPTPRRSLANALKYATAFPVIFFSAMQTVIGDPFDEDEDAMEDSRWIGRSALFYLWVLAVLVNSLYSFWWDITNDWGLSLLTPGGWSSSPTISYSFIHSTSPDSRPTTGTPRGSVAAQNHHRTRSGHLAAHSLNNSLSVPSMDPPPPSRPHSPTLLAPGVSTPSKVAHGHRIRHSRAFSTAAAPNLTYPFLRPILLLPDPVIYYFAIAIDLVLRFTWSLKLSSHLHSIHEVEAGVFLMEGLEVLRRWMWVYFRIEWEAVRKGGGGFMMDKDEGDHRLRAEEDYELTSRRDAPFTDDDPNDVGLGIHVAASLPHNKAVFK
ncbi:protein-ER retention protein [Microbotryomycetes sp. JL201]|nr:protein-ER retention protein [Microbotryomycetes sp. JL201]